MESDKQVPEEDKYLCRHDWRDLYGGYGSDKRDPYKAYQAFFCVKCLCIRVKSWRRDNYKLDSLFLSEYDDEDLGGIQTIS